MHQHDLRTQLQEAITLAQSGQRAEARALLRAIVEADPDQALAWMWLATVSSDRAERIRYLERVLALEPENVTARQAYHQLTGQDYTPPETAPGRAGARPVWMQSLTGDAPISIGNYLVVLAVAAVVIVVIMVAVGLRDDNKSGEPRATPRLVLPTFTPSATWRYSPTPTLTPLPRATAGPSPTSVWDAPPPTWTLEPTRTQPPSNTPRPTLTPRPTRTDTPTAAPPSDTPEPVLTETPNARTMTAEFALTSDRPRSTSTLTSDLKTATVKFEQTIQAATAEAMPSMTWTPTVPTIE